ncbi:MAG: ribonuclease HII [Nitrospinales bacterium]
MFFYEAEAKRNGCLRVAGIDEAGRGPLAGPVVAAAVILPDECHLEGVRDSKKLSHAMRERLFPLIRRTAVGFGVAVVEADVIDEINILQAARLAMKRAVEQLPSPPDFLLIDGNCRIDSPIGQRTIIGGDNRSRSIAAASVLAKVTRDRLMMQYHGQYPQYAFDRHKGYGTRLHRDRIKTFGPCPIHRRTFKGVREFLR